MLSDVLKDENTDVLKKVTRSGTLLIRKRYNWTGSLKLQKWDASVNMLFTSILYPLLDGLRFRDEVTFIKWSYNISYAVFSS